MTHPLRADALILRPLKQDIMPGRIALFSTSSIHGSGYLEYCGEAVQRLFEGCRNLWFAPYARPSGISHDGYHELAAKRFSELGLQLQPLHLESDSALTLKEADGIFIGGGNTFVLLNELYRQGLLPVIRQRVADGMCYMGSSAGSNMAGLSIGTSNDMPIVHPPSFEALGLVPFNLNPHYLDPDPTSTHKGETRETRIREFHVFNPQPVIGLREGSWIEIENGDYRLEGTLHARVFRAGKEPIEVPPQSLLNPLLS